MHRHRARPRWHMRAHRATPDLPGRQRGLCVPTPGRLAASWPRTPASAESPTAASAAQAPQPPVLVTLRKTTLYCTLEALPKPLTNKAFSSEKPWKASGSMGVATSRAGRMCTGEGRASPPPNLHLTAQPERMRVPVPQGPVPGVWAPGRGLRRPRLPGLALCRPLDKSVNIAGPVPLPVDERSCAQA